MWTVSLRAGGNANNWQRWMEEGMDREREGVSQPLSQGPYSEREHGQGPAGRALPPIGN